jgi:hypothetical protein
VAQGINLIDPVEINKMEQKQQTLDIDIFYVDQLPFLVSLSSPLKLCIVDLLSKGDKAFSNLSKVLTEHLNLYRSEGFYINSVSSDNEPSMLALKLVIRSSSPFQRKLEIILTSVSQNLKGSRGLYGGES